MLRQLILTCAMALKLFFHLHIQWLWYNVFTILRKARWLDVVCSLKLGQSECVLIDGWRGYIVVPFLRMDSLGRVVCRRLCAACRFDARLLEELQN